ncbi:elongin-A [Pseudophryne corroboree]|uniref:elongin-A n=1 Tax=Pseudophryne corroboree TaxID=495146 RepID=UPI0030812B66
MAESVVEVVEKLQSRLSASAEPKKLLKTLKRLSELPITVDILVETGVGKTVNGLRKHDLVGDLAKNLVGQWKKLVPQEIPRTAEPEVREHSKSSSRKKPRSPSPIEDEEEYEDESDERYRPHSGSGKEEDTWNQYSEHEDSEDNGRGYSPEQYSPPPFSRDRNLHKVSKDEKSHKEKHRSEIKSLNPEKKKEKQGKAAEDFPSYAGSSREKLPSPEGREHMLKKEKNRHSVTKTQTDDILVSKKSKYQEKMKSDKHRTGFDMQLAEKGKISEKDQESVTKDKADKNKTKTHTTEPGTHDKKSIKLSLPPPEPELDDVYEKPTMSFESYLSYDQPQKKKKKPPVKPTVIIPEKSNKKHSESKSESRETSKHKSKQATDKKSKRESSSVLPSKIDQVPVLPDIPLPMIQPNYRPLPSIEAVPFSPHKRKAPLLSSQDEEEGSGFTGRRLNSKMQVYSGSKTAYLPKMMSLYEQCIRVLANNIDSIYEVGGVPYSVLEPVLEKCTPDQLYRIEECNHVLVEDTDQLWKNHCIRDFKKQNPGEYESWRELYLRLHEAREQRLLMLTENIRSAHANKPKVRQAKMAFVNTEVKPPRDVRRRQEKFGTGAAIVNEKIRIKPFIAVSSSSSSSSSNNVSSEAPRLYEGPSTSCTVSAPSSVQPGYDPRKPQVKKVAPMMAKTIKAFKNRFSRR